MTKAGTGANLNKLRRLFQARHCNERRWCRCNAHTVMHLHRSFRARQHDLTAEHITFVEPHNVKISTDVSGYNRQFNIRSETSTCLNLVGTFIDR